MGFQVGLGGRFWLPPGDGLRTAEVTFAASRCLAGPPRPRDVDRLLAYLDGARIRVVYSHFSRCFTGDRPHRSTSEPGLTIGVVMFSVIGADTPWDGI